VDIKTKVTELDAGRCHRHCFNL